MSHVVVTGATGFIGSAVVQALSAAGDTVIALTRQTAHDTHPALTGIHWQQVTDYSTDPVLKNILAKADCLVMLADQAGRSTIDDTGRTPHTAGTLAHIAQDAGVSRMIYASSIYARLAQDGLSAGYGAYKWANEQAISSISGCAPVFLRLPPVYGKNGRGGFQTLCKMVEKLPILPFGRATAQRSYIHVDTVADIITHLAHLSADQWAAIQGTAYEPSDTPAISTRDLITALANAMERTPVMLPVPIFVLRGLGRVTGKSDAIAGALDPLVAQTNPSLLEDTGWVLKTRFPDTIAYLKP